MGHLTLRNHYEVPIEKLFALGIDPHKIPLYMPWISDIRDICGPLDKVESRFTFTDNALGRKVDGTAEVIAVEYPTTYETLTKYTNGMQVRWKDLLTAVGDGTDALTEIEYEFGSGMLQKVAERTFLDKIIDRRMRFAFENFKLLVEADVPELVTA